MQFSGYGRRWDDTWTEMRHQYQDLNWGETLPGCSRDLNIGTCMEVRCEYGDLDGIKMRPLWRGGANLWTLMEVRRFVDGGATRILWPVFCWYRTWMEFRCTSWNRDGLELVPRGSWDANSGDQNGGEASEYMGLDWEGTIDAIWMDRNVNLEAWIEVRRKSQDLDGGEMGNVRLRPGWSWGAIRWGTWYEWGWDSDLVTWMEVIQYMDGGNTIIFGSRCRWGRNWVDGRSTF